MPNLDYLGLPWIFKVAGTQIRSDPVEMTRIHLD